MSDNPFAATTKRSSKTFYLTSLLFPRDIRDDVFVLYAFVRYADDLVDHDPPKVREFTEFRQDFLTAWKSGRSDDFLISEFIRMCRRRKIPLSDVEDYFTVQKRDLTKRSIRTFRELTEFTYGVAEVIGVMMARIMGLAERDHEAARKLGRAMQLLNIIRDIPEDARLGKTYVPTEDMEKFGIESLKSPGGNPESMKRLIRYEIDRFTRIMDEADPGICRIPKQYRIAVQTAAELYKHVAGIIHRDPLIVYRAKVRPGIFAIFRTAGAVIGSVLLS